VGIGRALAVYYLDKLVEAGLLTQAAEKAAAELFAPESFQLTTLG